MCLQDLRISRRLSRRVVEFSAEGEGFSGGIDMSRVESAYLYSGGGAAGMFTLPSNSPFDRVPFSTEVGPTNDGVRRFYRRDVGAAWSGQVYLYTDSAETVTLVLNEYDADTMHEIYGPLKG